MSTLAITGGTGFVGSHLIELALARGHAVRALTRRPADPRDGLTWIDGALDRPAALDRLAAGADAVVHVAGVINGDAAAFRAGNVAGTEAVVAACARAGVRRLVHVSSLAAREPGLSAYGASKAEAEDVVRASGLAWTMVRPPAIYGPRDRELVELFRLARLRVVPVPAGTRLSVIHVGDLARLLLDVVDRAACAAATYEADDGRPGGWAAADFARAIGAAAGRAVLPLPLGRGLLDVVARLDVALRRAGAKLTRDRVAYFTHPDWAVAEPLRPPADVWRPAIATPDGLAATAAWYRAAGWLR